MNLMIFLLTIFPWSPAQASPADAGAFLKACADSNGHILNEGQGQLDLTTENEKEVYTCYLDSFKTDIRVSSYGKSMRNENQYIPGEVMRKFLDACGDELKMTAINSEGFINASCSRNGIAVRLDLVGKTVFTCPK